LKKIILFVITAAIICLSACMPSSSTVSTQTPPQANPTISTVISSLTPNPTSNNTSAPVIKTSIGDFAITSARYVDEVNGTQAQAGGKILLLILAQPDSTKIDKNSFSLEAFQKELADTTKGDQVHLASSDGAYVICTMAGWIGEEFAMGFMLSGTEQSLTLSWAGNDPIDISGLIAN